MKIKKLKVKAFRGFVSEKEFEFAPVTIFFGSNGKGKSSTLNAIEWCLFGKDCIGKNTDIRERIDWEIKNRSSKEDPLVEIELENGNRIVRRWKSEKKDEYEATDNLDLLKRYSFKDFLVGVYQHQEVIRAILIEEPKVRNEGFDRLFGLSEHRNFLDSLQEVIKKEFKVDQLEDEFNSFKNKIESDVKAWTDLINRNKQNLKEEGVSDDEINRSGESKYKSEILKELKNLIKELLLEPSEEFVTLSSESPTKKFIDIIKRDITKFRSEMPDIKRQKELFDRQTKLSLLLTEYENAKKHAESEEKKLKDFIEKEGKIENLENKKKEIDERIKQIEFEKDQKNLRAAVIEKAFKYLERDGVNKNVCPVCGKVTENLLSHLKTEWERKYKLEIEELNKQLNLIETEKKKIEGIIKNIESLEQNKELSRRKLKENIQQIGERLEREIKEDEDPKVIIGKEIEKIEAELVKIKKAVDAKQDRLNDIERKILILEKIGDILEKELLREKAREVEDTEEWQKMKEKKEDLLKLKEKLENIISAIREASKKEVNSTISTVKDKINQYFKEITNHPAIKELVFEVKENSYEIKDSDGKSVIPILSQGNLNALALSVFLALCENLPFGFIMLDDPSQSLSSNEKERFIEILDKVSQKKDIIISTMDGELHNYLLSKIAKQKKKYVYEDWDPLKGPIIKEEV
ncbi:MAG: AAA family ATPase [Deltaproteobacteria bacterium]|nr:AAA family ATPase [Deltaproteobacteria bacterium]